MTSPHYLHYICSYDAYGNCTILSTTNSTIANANPFRYRGYYFDSETGFYYLNARYYNPEWRRFISPDDTAYLDSENVNGLNLYCYCGNDPVNYCDPSGHEPEWIENILLGIGIIALTALAVTALTFTGGTAGAFFLAAGKTALVGLQIATTAGAVSGVIRTGMSLGKNISSGNSFSETMYNAGRSFLAGFGDGFLNGAIYYASTAIISIGTYKLLGLYNGGYGLIKESYMIGYQNPNVLGITFYTSRLGNKFRVDLDPLHSIHYHYGKTKKLRDVHRGSWIGGIFVGIYSGFNGVVY